MKLLKRPVSRRWLSPALPALAGIAAFSLLSLSACSDTSSHRMSESEALRYKHSVIQAHPGAISVQQVQLLGQHPARTRAGIDAAFEEYRAQHAEAERVERARLEAERKAARKKAAEENAAKGQSP